MINYGLMIDGEGAGGDGEPEEESEEYCLSWNGYNEQLSIVFRELCKVRTAFGGLFVLYS